MERRRTLRSKIAQRLYALWEWKERMPQRVLEYNPLLMIEEVDQICIAAEDPRLISIHTTEIDIPPRMGAV